MFFKKKNNPQVAIVSGNNRTVEYDRDSVCMGDDCMSHKTEKNHSGEMSVFSLLMDCAHYVPNMHNSIWAVVSSNTENLVIGYILTDENGNHTVETEQPDSTLEELFGTANKNSGVFCRYFHMGRFTWCDGETDSIVEEYPECKTLYEKVKKKLHEYPAN